MGNLMIGILTIPVNQILPGVYQISVKKMGISWDQ